MLMIVPIQEEGDFDNIQKTIRTEDVRDYKENVYDRDQTVISFYEEIEPLIIQEDFDTFHKRFSEIEAAYYDMEDNKESE